MSSYEFGDGVITILIVVPDMLHYPWKIKFLIFISTHP